MSDTSTEARNVRLSVATVQPGFRDQHGKAVVLLTLSDGEVAALHLTDAVATALVGAMGGDSMRVDGARLGDLRATHAAAVKAVAVANVSRSATRAMQEKGA